MISPDTIIAIAAVIGVVVLGLTVVILFGFVMWLSFLHILGSPGLSKRQFRWQEMISLQV